LFERLTQSGGFLHVVAHHRNAMQEPPVFWPSREEINVRVPQGNNHLSGPGVFALPSRIFPHIINEWH
jgi:hypothetical protein